MSRGLARRRTPRTAQGGSAGPAATWQPSAAWFETDDGSAHRAGHVDEDLVSLGFLSAALRRSRRLWAALAVIGLLLGVAFWMSRPPTPQAATTLLLNVGPEGQPGTAILNEQVMAESRGVAELALHKLQLQQTVDSLLSTYKATVLTDQFLRITASAPSSEQAVTRANAIAAAFLAFRADQLRKQQDLYFGRLDNTLTGSQQKLQAIKAKTSQVANQPPSDSQRAALKRLQEQGTRAEAALNVLKDQVSAAKSASEQTTAAMVGQSEVLDQANPLAQSRLKPLVIFGGAGAVIGLFLGAGFIIVRALVSDRLRRRDDVAIALGAPVRLSIPARRGFHWRPGRRGLSAVNDRDVKRVVAFLDTILSAGPGPRSLAVVPVDETRVAALSVFSLAASLARQDVRVVVVDMCYGTPAANLVGRAEPGLHSVQVDGVQLEVGVPDPDDIAPIGPYTVPGATTAEQPHDGPLSAACASADVLLTLATLDPSLPSDHLRTWAADAVAVVTAGRSSWTRIQAVGELLRLAGTRLVAAVLLGADKWDESLGVRATRGADRDAA
jgi:capsular polysaccharide biosynthesis protein